MAFSREEIRELKKKKYRIVVEKTSGAPKRTEVFSSSIKHALVTARNIAKMFGDEITGSLQVDGCIVAWEKGMRAATVYVEMLEMPNYVSIKHRQY